MSAAGMLSIRNLDQFYGGSHTLWDVTMEIPKGSITCLMGRNGMGKTTLLRCVMGLVSSKSGEIRYEGQDLRLLPAEQRPRLGIGYVPQGREIFAQLTVEENLRIGLPVRRTPSRGVPEHLYEIFPVLKKMLRRRGGDLSGGQQQQLAIARALVIEPRLLILDEPCEGIQPNIVHEIGDVILELNNKYGLTVLLVEQKLPFARRVANEFRVLDKGRFVVGGAIAELTDDLVRHHLTV
jgi:urea transport system ATP-binding protein